MPKFLSLDESKKLLSSVDKENNTYERDYCILTLFLNCGMRLSELVGINLTDIEDDMTKLTVTGKGSKQRVIYLNNACRTALFIYISVRQQKAAETKKPIAFDSKTALFLSGRNQRISIKTVQWLVKRHLELAGLSGKGYSTHKLRHTAATLMYNTGNVDVRTLKDILGHEQLNTTQIYTHVSNKKLEQAMSENPLSDVTDYERTNNKNNKC
ncbi:MAG: tyrosine-type recombinase/integrase [Clostridia bacterium]